MRQHGEDRLSIPPAPPSKCPVIDLVELTTDLVRMVAKRCLDGIGLVQVAQGRRCAMGIEIIHILVRVDAPALRRACTMARRGPSRFGAVMWPASALMPITGQLGVDPGAAGLGMFQLLEHQNARAFPQHETVAVTCPTGRDAVAGIVIACRQGAHGRKAANSQRRHRGLGTTGHDHVGIAIFDHACRPRRYSAGRWCRP